MSKYYLTRFSSMGRDSSQIPSLSAFEGASLCVIVKRGSGHTWMVFKRSRHRRMPAQCNPSARRCQPELGKTLEEYVKPPPPAPNTPQRWPLKAFTTGFRLVLIILDWHPKSIYIVRTVYFWGFWRICAFDDPVAPTGTGLQSNHTDTRHQYIYVL